jgi:hypothetical protein
MRLSSVIIAASLAVAGAAFAQNGPVNQPNNIRDQKEAPTTAPPETTPSPAPNAATGSTSTVRPNTPAPEAAEKK